jgi:hypothetical protein
VTVFSYSACFHLRIMAVMLRGALRSVLRDGDYANTLDRCNSGRKRNFIRTTGAKDRGQ